MDIEIKLMDKNNDITLPLEDFEYIVQQGVAQNKGFFEAIADHINDVKKHYNIENKTVN